MSKDQKGVGEAVSGEDQVLEQASRVSISGSNVVHTEYVVKKKVAI